MIINFLLNCRWERDTIFCHIHQYRCMHSVCGMYHSSVGGCGDSQTSCHPQETIWYRYIPHWIGVVCVCVYHELPPAPVAVYDEVVLPIFIGERE